MAKVDDAPLVDRFARDVAAALVAEIGQDVALSRLAKAMGKADDSFRYVYEDIVAALRHREDARDGLAAE